MVTLKIVICLILALPPGILRSQDYSITEEEILGPMLASVEAQRIAHVIQEFSGFHTRFYRTREALVAAQWLKAQWESLGENRPDVEVNFYHHDFDKRPQHRSSVLSRDPRMAFSMPSLILTVRGRELPGEIIVLGGHADSIVYTFYGPRPRISPYNRAPGADDNASGIATLTEVLRVLMLHNYRPKRTVMMMAYSAEEMGSWGSGDIAQEFRQEKKKVIGMLNLDMTNFQGSPDLDIVIMSDRKFTDPEQNAFLSRLIDTYLPGASWEYGICGYSCSDHASWAQQGFRASWPYEARFDESNEDIHTPLDTFEKFGGHADHSVDFAKLALAYLVELDR